MIVPLYRKMIKTIAGPLATAAPKIAGRPPILLGEDLQSKLKEFISPIIRLDRLRSSYNPSNRTTAVPFSENFQNNGSTFIFS